jgi:hypothetical protein
MAKKTPAFKRSRSDVTNPVAQVAGRIGGTTVAMIALIMIFGEGFRWVAFPVAFAMAIFGIFLGYYASKQ